MDWSELVEECAARVKEFLEALDERIRNLDEKDQLRLALIAALALILLFSSFMFLLTKSSSGLTILVTDENGQPVNDAWVKLFDLDGNLVANASSVNGQARFSSLPMAAYDVTVTHAAYQKVTSEFLPEEPLSAVIRLKSIRTDGSNPTSPPLGPLPLPSPPVVIPTRNDKGSNFADSDVLKQGQYQSDARLKVSVRDKDGKPVYNAFVTLKDASTAAFLVQGQTGKDGLVEAGVKKGSVVLIRVVAEGYAVVEPKVAAMSGVSNDVEFVLVSSGSSGAALTQVSVMDSNRTSLSGARVQIFSSPPVVDEFTSSSGRISVFLEAGKKFSVFVSKSGYSDAVANLSSGDAVEIVLNSSPAFPPVVSASLLVSVTDAKGKSSKSALIGVFKRVGSVFVPLLSATADSSGLALFQGLEAGLTLQVNATAGFGVPTQTKDVLLLAGNNSVVLSIDYLSEEQEGQSKTVANVTVERFSVCVNSKDGPSFFTANGYNYTLAGVSSTSGAAFGVNKDNSVVCAAYSPDCTYSLGEATAGNNALAKITNVNLSVVSIQLQKACVNVSATITCTGSSCNVEATCPRTKSPVCGSNGVTYLNSCEASLDRVAYISGTCSTQCTDQFDPVCSVNGIQYSNACKAIAANVAYLSGACLVPVGAVTVDVPAGWSAIAPPNSGSLLATNCTIGEAYLFQGYNPTTNQYFTVKPTFNTAASMRFATGYLTYSDKSCRLYWENATAPSYQKELKTGWNLVGAPKAPIKVNDVTGNCSTAVFYSVWGATDLTQYGTRLTSEDLLVPGRGYWVSVVEAGGAGCTLKPMSSVCPGGRASCPAESLCRSARAGEPNTAGFVCEPLDASWTSCGDGKVCPGGRTCIAYTGVCSIGDVCPLYMCGPTPTLTPTPAPTAIPEPDKLVYLCTAGFDGRMISGGISTYEYVSESNCGIYPVPPLRAFGKVYSSVQPDSLPLYDCGFTTQTTPCVGSSCGFPAESILCKGVTYSRLLGYIPSRPTPGFELAYRCQKGVIYGEYFTTVTFSSTCDNRAGFTVAETVGYFKRV